MSFAGKVEVNVWEDLEKMTMFKTLNVKKKHEKSNLMEIDHTSKRDDDNVSDTRLGVVKCRRFHRGFPPWSHWDTTGRWQSESKRWKKFWNMNRWAPRCAASHRLVSVLFDSFFCIIYVEVSFLWWLDHATVSLIVLYFSWRFLCILNIFLSSCGWSFLVLCPARGPLIVPHIFSLLQVGRSSLWSGPGRRSIPPPPPQDFILSQYISEHGSDVPTESREPECGWNVQTVWFNREMKETSRLSRVRRVCLMRTA